MTGSNVLPPEDEEFKEMFEEAKKQYPNVQPFLLKIALKASLIDQKTPKRKGKKSFLEHEGRELPDEYKQKLNEDNIYHTIEVLPPTPEENGSENNITQKVIISEIEPDTATE